jgi:hypothetical protein
VSNTITPEAVRKSFSSTSEHEHRQFMRRAVRKAKISKNERDVVLALMNIWFVRKSDGEMHPGRKKIAKMAGVSIRTVASIMARMRETEALLVVSHGKGGRASTRYRMNLENLILFLGYEMPRVIEGELRKIVVAVGNFVPFSLWKKRATAAHGIRNYRIGCSSQTPTRPDPGKNSLQISGGRYV